MEVRGGGWRRRAERRKEKEEKEEEEKKKKKKIRKNEEDAHYIWRATRVGAPRARGALNRVRHEGDGAAEDEETEEHERL